MGIADGQTGDLVGRPDIGLHQGRRHRQGVRHIVEIPRAPIRRQQRVHVHLEREQVADRVAVLSTIDAVKGRRGSMRAGSGRPIDPCFERQSHCFERFGLGARHARRRHHPGAQLSDDLLHLLRILLGMRNIHRGPREISQLRVDPVAHDTILFHQLTLLLDSGPIVHILGERNLEACGACVKGEPGR